MGVRQDIHDHIVLHKESHLERVRSFMAQPSVSQENHGVEECASLLQSYFQELGCNESEIAETPGLPAVWAYYDAGAPRTLAVYSYFDTNVVGEGWEHNPYDAVVTTRSPFKKVLFGRGAGNKGTFIAFLNALFSIKQVMGNLPVNLMFLSEGEEFVGSGHIPMLIERYRDHLEGADALIVPGASQTATGDVTLFLGNKGCLHIELESSGDLSGKGPVGGPVHSSAQPVVDHPVWRLIHAVSTLYDPNENRILVDGFYEGLREADEADMTLVEELATIYNGRESEAIPNLAPGKVHQFINGESGRDIFLRYCFQPTMNINGFRAGYTGLGTLLWTLPHAAYCTIDHRLPPDLDPEVCLAKIRAHLDRNGYDDIGIKVLMSVPPQKLSVTDEIAQAAIRVFRDWGIQPVVWPRKGASGPMGFFSHILGLRVLGATGMGHASGHSGGNEFLVIEGDGRVGGLQELEQSFVDLLLSYATYPAEY